MCSIAREVHSRFTKEDVVENEIDGDSTQAKKLLEDDLSKVDKQKAKKDKTQAEITEEKSIWDGEDDEKVKKMTVNEVDKSSKRTAKKSFTEPEAVEEKSFWDDVDDSQSKQPIIDEPDTPIPNKAKKSATPAEVAEEKSFWDDVDDDKPSKPVIDEIESNPNEAGKKSFSEPEKVEEKSFWDENHNEQNKKPLVEEVFTKKEVGERGATKPDIIEEVPIPEELKSPKRKTVKKQAIEEPLSAESEGIHNTRFDAYFLQNSKQLSVCEKFVFSRKINACFNTVFLTTLV